MWLIDYLPSPRIKLKRVFIDPFFHVNRHNRCHNTASLRNMVPYKYIYIYISTHHQISAINANTCIYIYTIELINSPLISTSLVDFLQIAFTILASLRVSLITFM